MGQRGNKNGDYKLLSNKWQWKHYISKYSEENIPLNAFIFKKMNGYSECHDPGER